MNPVRRGYEQFDWYESGLSPGERKRRGHFSTPPALVDQILDACGYTSHADLSAVRVLDPACGSGNFLVRAARRLCQAGPSGLDDPLALVQKNLWGLDPDPVACCLAEMQVRSVVAEFSGSYPDLPRLHIHQADSLTLPWQPCVDLLLANPPYLAAKNTDLSHYRRAQQRGQTDSYLLFLDLALQAVRPGGWIGLVLPDPVLARSNAASERVSLLRTCTLHHIWHLSGVFEAEVGAVVIIARKLPPRTLHCISWTRTRWQTDLELVPPEPSTLTGQRVNQLLLACQPDSALRYLLSTTQGRVVERLRRALGLVEKLAVGEKRSLALLNELVSIKRGEEIGRNNAALGLLATLPDAYPVLRGGVDVRPYARPEAAFGISRSAISKPLERYLTPKLLVVKSTGRLQAALDTHGHVVLQTLYLLHLREGDATLDTAYFLLALLNSRFLRAYVYHLHTAYKLVQPQIEQIVLARLPVPCCEPALRQEISLRAREMERICSATDSVVEWNEQLNSFYEEQERAICALYTAALSTTRNGEGVTPHV
jgi:SAM-dependent methyltransferase